MDSGWRTVVLDSPSELLCSDGNLMIIADNTKSIPLSEIRTMFDLPILKKEQQKAYRIFKKFLLTNGYRMIQESLYVKLLHNVSNSKSEIFQISLSAPKDGNIQVLPLTLLNFRKMTSICGSAFDMELFCDDIVYL